MPTSSTSHQTQAFLLGGLDELYFNELKEVTHIAHDLGMKVKAMLEFGFITEEAMKIKATRYAYEAGIDWVKQSSGWGKGGCAATVEDVQLLKANIQAPCRVKVSGKVNTLEDERDVPCRCRAGWYQLRP